MLLFFFFNFILLHLLGALPSSDHNRSSTISTFTWPRLGQGNLAPPTIYTVPGPWMDLVILIFFCVPMVFVSIVKTRGKRDSQWKRERRGKKTSLTEAQSIISQVFDWSDCKRSRRFPRAMDWAAAGISQEQNPIQQKWRNSSFEWKTRQRMQKKRLPAQDKVESRLALLSSNSTVTHSLSYSLVF